MLKGPGLKSLGLYIYVFQDRPDRGRKNMFKNMFEKGYKITKKVKNDICYSIVMVMVMNCNIIKSYRTYFSHFWMYLGPLLVELIFEHILLTRNSKDCLFNFGPLISAKYNTTGLQE